MVASSLTQSLILDSNIEFKFILRILNTNIDGKRKIPYGIRMIKGVGRRFAVLICKIARINANKRFSLSNAGVVSWLRRKLKPSKISSPTQWPITSQNGSSTDRTTTETEHTAKSLPMCWKPSSETTSREWRRPGSIFLDSRSHRGLRHYWGLKVRGQHTKSTGRRGATLGVQRKK